MNCETCPFKEYPSCGSRGSKSAKIAIVGRNPGKKEAETGIPFVGASGQLLNAVLDRIDLTPEDVYITNAVNCHFPNDDAPPKEAYSACQNRLYSELKEVDPAIILTMGDDATKALITSSEKISSLVGTMQYNDKLSKWVLPTYHPAYILRGNISAYDDLEMALDRAKRLAQGVTPLPSPLSYQDVIYITDYLETKKVLFRLLDSEETIFALDTETDFARDPNYNILLVQISDGKIGYVFEADCLKIGEVPELFKYLLLSKTWVIHNSAFDLQQLLHHWQINPEDLKVIDTMALALCLNENLSACGLKKLVNNYLSVPHYETELSKYRKHSKVPFSAVPREVLVPYAGFDAIYTRQLYPVLKSLVETEGNYNLFENVLNKAQVVFSELTHRGINVDKSMIETLRKEFYPVRDNLIQELKDFAKRLGFSAKECVKSPKDLDLNVNSPKQLIYFINNYLKIKTDTSDASFIDRYKDSVPFIRQLKKYRTLAHLLNTYVDGIADELWPDGRVHPEFLLAAVTGRLAIHHPALQTLPNEWIGENEGFGGIRKLFIPSSEDLDYLSSDYKQLEIRVAAYITKDQALQFAVDSKDIHRITASNMFGKSLEDITDEERTFAKRITFGVMYGAQEYHLSMMLGCSIESAKEYIRSFFQTYPDYAKWWLETRNKALSEGELTTEFGRKRRWKIITREMENHIKNEAVNFPIQSTASDITLTSLIKLHKLLKDSGYGNVLFTVHDSIEFEIRKDCLEKAIKLIREVMEYPFGKDGQRFPVDIEYGKSMGETTKCE